MPGCVGGMHMHMHVHIQDARPGGVHGKIYQLGIYDSFPSTRLAIFKLPKAKRSHPSVTSRHPSGISTPFALLTTTASTRVQ